MCERDEHPHIDTLILGWEEEKVSYIFSSLHPAGPALSGQW